MAFLSLICFSINHNHSKARPRACTIHIMYKMIQIGLSTEHKKLLYVLYSAFTLVCVCTEVCPVSVSYLLQEVL